MSLPAPDDLSRRMRGGSDVSESVSYQSIGIMSVLQNAVNITFGFYKIAGYWIPNQTVSIYKLVLNSHFRFLSTSECICGLFRFPADADVTLNPQGKFSAITSASQNNGVNVSGNQPLLVHAASGIAGTTFSKCNGLGWSPLEGLKVSTNEMIAIAVSNGGDATNIVRGIATVHYRVDQLLPPPRR